MTPAILKGTFIQLEPLDTSHREALSSVAENDAIWTYSFDPFSAWFDKAIDSTQREGHAPFIVRRLSDNKIIGSTRYYHVDPKHRRLTIGYTWYTPDAWGSHVNPECKLLLLTFAFEKWLANRVEFCIDSRNLRSRAAVKKLGATEEGILRHHMILKDGVIRDTVIFSIIKPDWPHIKSTLQARLHKQS